jgi:cell division protein FtsI/penicillin-binding protein 2
VRKQRVGGLALAVAALAAIAAGVWSSAGRDDQQDEAEATSRAYLRAWQASDRLTMEQLIADPPPDMADRNAHTIEALRIDRARFTLGRVEVSGDRASATFSARLHLRGLGDWSYRGRLPLVRRDGRWLIAWSPAAVHPALRPGLRLRQTRSWPRRAPILARDGKPLSTAREVIVVGVEPRRIKSRRRLLAALRRYAGADPRRVAAELARPGVQPDWFIPVTELRPNRYERVKPQLYPVPGTVFRRSTARLAPTDDFGFHVLGRVGDVTEELLTRLGNRYTPGDRVGLFGLERAFERRLAGRPSGTVQVVDKDGKVVRVLERVRGARPRPLRTTLDLGIQTAAERALATVRRPAALVAVDALSGDLLAVASRPTTSYERALAARYPPGSTFKIVTTAALLARGLTPSDVVPCPGEAIVGGKPFRNFENAALGAIPFRDAFSQSCNTAFVQLAERLSDDALASTAAQFGFGAAYELPLPVAGGRFPAPRDLAERAAQAIGQGRVEASPIHMATVAAAVVSGAWRPPRLLVEDPSTQRQILDRTAVANLRELMRLVVTFGTGQAASVAEGGKTGTAEFGQGERLRTHAWFIGFRGRIGFAVFVEGGGVGGQVAAPVAARFLASIVR